MAAAESPTPQRVRWLSTGQAARLLGVRRDTVRRWCEAGWVEGAWQVAPGSHWRIPSTWLRMKTVGK